MDWNTLLFASKWAIIGLVYFVLFLLLLGVYGEMSQRVGRKRAVEPASIGRLRLVHPGKDRRARPGQVFNLQVETRIGAGADNEIVLGDPYVSGHHASLRWDGANWWVEDLGSRNGTTVDQKPIAPRRPQPLPPGSRLGIGEMTFELLD